LITLKGYDYVAPYARYVPRPPATKGTHLPQSQPARSTFSKASEHATEAAEWMREQMGRNKGVLTLDDAWKGVRERFGDTCAIKGETGNWLSKAVLGAFRKLTPGTIWDPAGQRWRAQERGDSVNQGGRMLNAKPR
jgi:hypothetical protein